MSLILIPIPLDFPEQNTSQSKKNQSFHIKSTRKFSFPESSLNHIPPIVSYRLHKKLTR